MATAMAERAAAAIALEAGDAELAARRALASAAAADEVGIPVEATLSRSLAGRALARAGEPERAAAVLDRAAVALHACRAEVPRPSGLELSGWGVTSTVARAPARPSGAGVASLTERERQVADLVVARCTNPEIAAALFLSPKTVETHLRHLSQAGRHLARRGRPHHRGRTSPIRLNRQASYGRQLVVACHGTREES